MNGLDPADPENIKMVEDAMAAAQKAEAAQ
jgi:hypothetical protein